MKRKFIIFVTAVQILFCVCIINWLYFTPSDQLQRLSDAHQRHAKALKKQCEAQRKLDREVWELKLWQQCG